MVILHVLVMLLSQQYSLFVYVLSCFKHVLLLLVIHVGHTL